MKCLSVKSVIGVGVISALLLVQSFQVSAQITVYSLQEMSFGAFFPGSTGGTLSVSHEGIRSATGDVIPMNTGSLYSPAIFEIEAPQGTVISILKGPDVTLSGNNGGSLTLKIGDANMGSSFNTIASPPDRSQIKVGGTLTTDSSASTPPGNYSGTFSITFMYE